MAEPGAPDEKDTLYKDLSTAIGDVCIWWSIIDNTILGLSLHMALLISPAFVQRPAWDALHVSLVNTDIRVKISTAKALAYKIDTPLSPNLHERTEALLNFVDNSLRNERNRYVHDAWTIDDANEIWRRKPGAVVRKTQANKRELFMFSARRFKDTEELGRFIEALESTYDDLVTLDNHLAWLLENVRRPKGSQQPLPQEWTSFAHRDWLQRDKQ